MELQPWGSVVEPLLADLATSAGRNAVVNRLEKLDISFVANVAGFGGYGAFADLPTEVMSDLLNVLINAPTEITRAAVRRSPEPTIIVNVSSLLALSADSPLAFLPARAIYAAAKSYLLTFTETLAGENIPGFRFQALLPGMVATEFNGGYSAANSMSAEDVVNASMRALERGDIVCVPGLEDRTALDRLREGRLAILAGGNQRELAPTYSAPDGLESPSERH